MSAEDAKASLLAAIERHKRHLNGTEPTSKASQLKMMEEMEEALEQLAGTSESPSGEKGEKMSGNMDDMEMEGVDLDSAMDSVIEDMGKAALQFKGKRYAPKPKPEAPAPAAPAEEGGPTLEELEELTRE